MKTLEVSDRAEWRKWLENNHHIETEIWLVFRKKGTGKSSIEYKAALEEALCYGWIDSIIKKLDDNKYVRKFTPRKADSQWSMVNKELVEQLIGNGLMTAYGLKKVEEAKLSGHWDNPTVKPQLRFEMPIEFYEALRKNDKARDSFDQLAPTYQKQYILWIMTAKLPETRKRRIEESVKLLSEGRKLGLK